MISGAMMHARKDYKNLALELNRMWFRVEQSRVFGEWVNNGQTDRVDEAILAFRWVKMKRRSIAQECLAQNPFALMP